MKNLYLIGGGGHCKSCIDVIELGGEYRILGVFDKPERKGEKLLGYEIVGSDDDLSKFVSSDVFFLVTIGQIKSPNLRMGAVQNVTAAGGRFATVVSPRAYVARTARVGEGSIVMHDAVVNSEAEVGRHCILNSKSLVEHESKVGDFVHLSTGAVLNGNVIVGDGSFVGSLSTTKEGIRIPQGSVLSAGAFHRGTEDGR